jgi:hypothetical protein
MSAILPIYAIVAGLAIMRANMRRPMNLA